MDVTLHKAAEHLSRLARRLHGKTMEVSPTGKCGFFIGETMKTKTIADRFWVKVEKSEGCWEWTGAKDRGYGQFWGPDQSQVLAHRYSWLIHHGVMPSPGILVCHKCDNPSCVRPDHLFLGSHKDNSADMSKKGRSPIPKWSKMDAKKILDIRKSSNSVKELAAIYNCNQSTITNILQRKTWKSF